MEKKKLTCAEIEILRERALYEILHLTEAECALLLEMQERDRPARAS